MTAIMLFHVSSKYTAIGRKEIVMFFYIYMFASLVAFFLDSTVIPTSSEVYAVSSDHCDRDKRRWALGRDTDGQWFTAVYAGTLGALYWCIVMNWITERDAPYPSTVSRIGPELISSFYASAVSSSGRSASLSRSRPSNPGPPLTTPNRSVSSSPTSSSPWSALCSTSSRN